MSIECRFLCSALAAVTPLLPPTEEVRAIQQFEEGGWSNRLWIVTTDANRYVLRDPLRLMDPKQFEFVLTIAKLAAKHGIGPNIVGVNTQTQQTVIEFISAKPWPSYSDNLLPYHDSMRVLRVFHEATRGRYGSFDQESCPFRFIRYATNLLHSEAVPVQMKECFEKCAAIYQAIRPMIDHQMVVCHGDFHKGNVLLTEKMPVIIDFDSASIGDPLFDVVKFSVGLPPDVREDLYKTYLGDRLPTDREKAHYALMDLVFLAVVAVIRFDKASQSSLAEQSSLSKQEMETLCSSLEPLPSFLSIPYSDGSTKARQMGAILALHEFLLKTNTSDFQDLLDIVRAS